MQEHTYTAQCLVEDLISQLNANDYPGDDDIFDIVVVPNDYGDPYLTFVHTAIPGTLDYWIIDEYVTLENLNDPEYCASLTDAVAGLLSEIAGWAQENEALLSTIDESYV